MRVVLLFVCLLMLRTGAAGDVDGRWRLTIDGSNTYLYGEPQLGGGVRIPWEVVIRFRVVDGGFEGGSGSARLSADGETLSHPPGWVSCRQVEGSYLDSNLELHDTPRIRFPAFPVAGEAGGGRVTLRPGYGAPGNYLAVTYECELHDDRGNHWFALAERGKQVMGKRQDAERRVDGDLLQVRVREVATLPPEGDLDLPLDDGWRFSSGAPGTPHWRRYRLTRE